MQLDCLVSVMFHDKIQRQLWLTVIDFLSSFQTHLIYLFFNRVLFIAPGVLFLCVFVGINTASTVSQLYSGDQLSQPCFCVSRQGLIESLREIGHFCDGSRFGMFWGFFLFAARLSASAVARTRDLQSGNSALCRLINVGRFSEENRKYFLIQKRKGADNDVTSFREI